MSVCLSTECARPVNVKHNKTGNYCYRHRGGDGTVRKKDNAAPSIRWDECDTNSDCHQPSRQHCLQSVCVDVKQYH